MTRAAPTGGTDDGMPPYLSPSEIAVCIPRATRRTVITELRSCGLIEKRENGRLRVDTSRLKDRLLGYYKHVFAVYCLGRKPPGRNDAS